MKDRSPGVNRYHLRWLVALERQGLLGDYLDRRLERWSARTADPLGIPDGPDEQP